MSAKLMLLPRCMRPPDCPGGFCHGILDCTTQCATPVCQIRELRTPAQKWGYQVQVVEANDHADAVVQQQHPQHLIAAACAAHWLTGSRWMAGRGPVPATVRLMWLSRAACQAGGVSVLDDGGIQWQSMAIVDQWVTQANLAGTHPANIPVS
ncbi:MAG: DUF116 domain-containing protein [Chloroflexi bacterium]|nr:DUF116 domain-containing protein [Chloroflexota bacterium]MBU1750409.1 DUF116 domain-containing protein [Chloroflexota bacterium]